MAIRKYSQEVDTLLMYRIGKQERLSANRRENKLGPGTYQLTSVFETNAPGSVPFTKADYYRGKNSV